LIQKIRKEVVEDLVENRSLGLIKAYFNRDSKYYYFDCCSINEIRLSWYINHSLSPNIKWDGDSIIAIKEINIGEELTINYHRRVI
jgi:SET domain-containing protein